MLKHTFILMCMNDCMNGKDIVKLMLVVRGVGCMVGHVDVVRHKPSFLMIHTLFIYLDYPI